MSRLTGTDAYGLMEAYQAVYTPQELTEEQVWEEVENWVSGLIEEGYDLSDYTWEEMYESYLEEAPLPPLSPALQIAADAGKRAKEAKDKRSVQDFFGIRQKPPAADQNQNQNQNRNRNLTATTPASPKVAPTKPTAPAAAKVAPKPALGPTGKPLVGGIERRLPTRAEMDAAKAARSAPARNGFGVSAAPIAAKSSVSTATASPTPAATPKPAPSTAAAKPTPAAVNRATGSKKPGSMLDHFDPFDIVKGHLIDEGYADTEEAALVIMANMSEEWRRSIVEQDTDSMADRTRRAVSHQRGGTHGDNDALKKAAEGLTGTMQKLRKQGQRGAYQGA